MNKEKVIKGLNQHCNGSMYDRCGECPYYKFSNEPFECRDELLEDIFTLLEGQKPIESIDFGDKTEIMANLEGLTWDDWRMYHSDTEVQNIAKSAFDLLIELLKEQEAKEVKESTNMYTGLPITHCPKCGVSLDRYLYGRQHEGQINYCPMCGQAVKWHD